MKTTKTLVALAALGLLLAHANAQSFLTNGLVAYYPFNGNSYEATGSGYNLTNFGAQLATDRFGNTNSAYSFNGSSYMITATNNLLPSGSANRTLSLWVKTDSSLTNVSGNYIAADYGSGASPNLAFGLFLGNRYWGIHFDGANQQVFSSIKPDTSWHQFVCIYSNGFAQMYVDGIQNTNAPWTTSTAVGRLIVGNNINGFSEYFRGIIDDIRIYNRALSSSEVTALYNAELNPTIAIFQAVEINSGNLLTGTNYQMQVSSDLINWTNTGSAFTANNTTATNFYPVKWNQLFFRLQRQ